MCSPDDIKGKWNVKLKVERSSQRLGPKERKEGGGGSIKVTRV